jgi:predicted component of type VI protein secretion system
MQHFQNLSQSVLLYQGRYYPLNKTSIVIGRDQNCDIPIENNPQVLPVHARIILQAGQVFLQYKERVWVNGLPPSQQALQDGDEIAVGDLNTRLTLLFNTNSLGADQTATRASQNGPTIGPHTVQNTGGMPGLNAPPAWSAASSGQMPPSIAATPAFGAAQSPGTFAARSQAQAWEPVATPQPQAPMPAMDGKVSDTTRYLCAAGHLDEGFQDYVMRHVIYEERRALGESYGVDMSAVVSWCKSGLNRINVRDGILTGLLF